VLSSTVRIVQSTRDLGVILDSKLSLSAHIAVLCRAGFFRLRQIRPAIQSLTPELPGPLFRRLLPVVWTGVTRYCMVCRRTCRGRCSQYRTPPLVYSPAHADVTTSHHGCTSYTGCQFRDEWSLRLRVLYTTEASFTCTDLPDY